MSKLLFTMAEEKDSTTESHFAVRYRVDENDCYDFSNGLKALGHTVYFVNWNDLSDGEFTRMFNDNEKQFVDPVPLREIDLTFVYKMEGFYFDLPRFLAMVELFESKCGAVINAPSTIRHNLDKSYLWDLQRRGVRIIPSHEIDTELIETASDERKWVIKPRRGERGNGIILASSPDDFKQIAGDENQFFAQEYMPAIRQGERSLVYLGFEFQHAVIKYPNPKDPNEFRCNESLGGTVAVYSATPDELQFAQQVLRAYNDLGHPIHFSRVDILATENGPTLLEAELLNPSIYANYSKQGEQFGRAIADYFNTCLKTYSMS